MLELPSEIKDPIKLADWLELIALVAHDNNASYGDLSSELRRSGAYEINEENLEDDGFFQDERIDEMCGEVFDELNHRAKSAEHSYPFEVDGSVLELKSKSTWEDYAAYVFCLCLSYFGSPGGEGTNIPRRLFEDMSKFAAQKFVGGDAVKMSPPREELPSSFSDAINELCIRIGEGDGYKEQEDSPLRPQDDRVDIVAWRHFPDNLPSKLILFGQCASNKHWAGWRSKLSDLDPDAFCDLWMLSRLTTTPLKSFFVPHRINGGRWTYAAKYAGILFDRCRISFWAHGVSDFQGHSEWVQNVCLKNMI